METTLQNVILRGGSFDGCHALAPASPGTLRLGERLNDDQWSELYMYVINETQDLPGIWRRACHGIPMAHRRELARTTTIGRKGGDGRY